MMRAAFLSFDWDFEITSAYYEGMSACIDEREDLQLVIFNAFGQYANYEPEEGAFEVFSLCNLEEYDGFLIQGNRTWPPDMRQKVTNEILDLGKPVVSVNYELNGAHCVGTNNYDAMYGLVSRVLADFGCSKPAFVNGLETSVEAQARAHAFRVACADCGVDDVRFYQASWEMEEGVRTALKMLEHPDDLPDVVFCCNDDLAVGVQETLQDHGVRIPQDVMVAGFDNREIGLKASPRITTIDRDYDSIGRTAMDVLIRLMDGEELPKQVSSPVRYVLAESCAYMGEAESREDIVEDLYHVEYALRHFYEVLTRFQPAVLNADTLLGILRECERYFAEVRCPRVYLTINDSYLVSDSTRNVTAYGTMSKLMAQTGQVMPMSSYERHVYTSFPTRRLLPERAPMDQRVYMVFPLRHNTTCIGTLVTEGVSPILRHGFLTIILTLLSSSIESVRKKELLRAANARLDDLYVHDQLTGLFNRFGLERIGSIAYEHLLRDFEEAQFIFVDIDYMKLINDSFGHEVGDLALRDTADIINRATEDENAFSMRYGGDEVLLICRRDLTGKLERELATLRDSCQRPYELSLSIGAFRVLKSDHLSVQMAIERADERMYEIKKANKAKRG